MDEARNDSLYELEIAFSQFPAPGTYVPPWLIDRLLRNLLIDVTGNTHRAEFCIDKLYSPDSSSGRLGLVEMRAFEMPPHARMSLVQQVLLRSLVARFWREPYAPRRLVRWGTSLHDRFLLPHFVRADFEDVLEEQARAGFDLKPEWFAPHFEFRFPKLGDLELSCGSLALRQALEPWHVMGEEGTGGGAVRYVDSSVERLEVKAIGLAPDRSVVTCNGRAIPLRPTGTRRRVRGGRALPRLAAVVRAASEHRRPLATDIRYSGHLDETIGRRLSISCGASGRTQSRYISGERVRGREPPARAVLPSRITRRDP